MTWDYIIARLPSLHAGATAARFVSLGPCTAKSRIASFVNHTRSCPAVHATRSAILKPGRHSETYQHRDFLKKSKEYFPRVQAKKVLETGFRNIIERCSSFVNFRGIVFKRLFKRYFEKNSWGDMCLALITCRQSSYFLLWMNMRQGQPQTKPSGATFYQR